MRLLLFVFCAFSLSSHAQDRSEIWFGVGAKREVAKNLIVGAQSNLRLQTSGNVQTLFQEIGIKSEHLKWFRPSIDYRFITSYADNGNTTYSSRFNLNADFRQKVKDIKLGIRMRYQLVIGGGSTASGDLDPAFRIKPYMEYAIPKTRFTPEFSAELFYNPVYGQFGRQFNRVRLGFGTSIDLPGPHTLSVTYYYGNKFATKSPYSEHLFSLEYSYEWRKPKSSKKSSKK